MHFHSVLLHVSDQHFLGKCCHCEVVFIGGARKVAVHQMGIAVPLGDGDLQGTPGRTPGREAAATSPAAGTRWGPAGASIPAARPVRRG